MTEIDPYLWANERLRATDFAKMIVTSNPSKPSPLWDKFFSEKRPVWKKITLNLAYSRRSKRSKGFRRHLRRQKALNRT
jgi:hypothetical protein